MMSEAWLAMPPALEGFARENNVSDSIVVRRVRRA